ncbi:hypothetical protein ACIQBJ_18145 [Kitasatospora sp. NPDC088391]
MHAGPLAHRTDPAARQDRPTGPSGPEQPGTCGWIWIWLLRPLG